MLRKLFVGLMILALVAMLAEDLLAQGRRGRGGRGFRPGAAQRQRNQQERQQNAEEQRMEREFGAREDDEDDDRPMYRGAEFTDAQIDREARKFVREYDTDRDGQLSEKEFEGVETADIFGFLDRNRDGQLSAEELHVYLREKLPADVAKEILDKETAKLMKRHDRDDDGTVEAEEFRGRDREFNEIDTNGDLKISEEEMRAYARKTFEDRYGRLPAETTRFENPTGGRAARGDRGDREELSDEERERRREEWQRRMRQRRNGGGDDPDSDGDGDGDEPSSGGGDDPDGDDEPSSGR